VPMLIRWPGTIPPGSVSNGIQSHEDLYVTLAAAAGLPDLTEKLLKGYKMGDTTYKVHLDGYNNLDHWTGKSEISARRVHFYYDETDLMAIRLDNWKMHIGIKPEGSWWDEKSYPSVPYVFNLRMDPMEKMDPQSHEWGVHRAKVLWHEGLGANWCGSVYRGSPQELDGLSSVAGGRYVKPEEGARKGSRFDGATESRR
jgi:arylsulfatase A-like enzyme